LKLDETNLKNVSVPPSELTQEMLKNFAENIKADRNALDLLFGCLINWGVELHFPHESETFEGATIHSYNDGDLIACFDKKISLNVIKYMAQKKALRAVFRDDCFTSDAQKINAGEIFKYYSPNTKIKVI
jgi:adenine-specific DNA-methyltransferase